MVDYFAQLSLWALTDLSSRRDCAKLEIVSRGGAAFCVRLLREADADDNERAAANRQQYQYTAAAAAAAAGSDDEVSRDGGAVEWKRTFALHLLLNCSSAPSAQAQVLID